MNHPIIHQVLSQIQLATKITCKPCKTDTQHNKKKGGKPPLSWFQNVAETMPRVVWTSRGTWGGGGA